MIELLIIHLPFKGIIYNYWKSSKYEADVQSSETVEWGKNIRIEFSMETIHRNMLLVKYLLLWFLELWFKLIALYLFFLMFETQKYTANSEDQACKYKDIPKLFKRRDEPSWNKTTNKVRTVNYTNSNTKIFDFLMILMPQ